MDPKACWNKLVDEVRRGDLEEAVHTADDLAMWLYSRGYRPDGVPLASNLDTFRRVLSLMIPKSR